MKEIDKYNTVAEAVRIEHDRETDSIYLVFNITDEQFKKEIKNNWLKDVPLKIINKKLVKFEE